VQPTFQRADNPQVSSESTPGRSASAAGLEDKYATESFKVRKKDLKRLHDSTRPLDGWERYRALIDATEEAYDFIDISNREARLALIVMGALNALPLVFLTRTDAITSLNSGERYAMAVLLSGYAVLLLFFILQAIEALRPGKFKPELAGWSKDRADHPAGVLYYEDILTRSATEYWAEWQHVRLAQLNAELAVQVHSLAQKNRAKHLAVRRLYSGLRAMALMLAAVLMLYGLFSWI
jgi:hypothetical protein